MIDLRSDTITRPTQEMRTVIANAEVGDDVFGEDPTVNELEEKLANMFGKESGLYCSSGTMANQIAIKTHTSPGDQVICSWAAHVYNYEGGGMASNSGVTAKLIEGARGLFKASDLEQAISPDDPHFPISRMVVIEDTSNKGGGAVWPRNDIMEISRLCGEKGLNLHLDGARVFNSLIATGTEYLEYGAYYDSMSICLSKGLGAPVGSVLLGPREFISKARRARKSFGGGMRQAGIIAAAGLFALENCIDRLITDHDNAKLIESALRGNPLIKEILPVETNIILFSLTHENMTQNVLDYLENKGILALATGPKTIRFVLHKDIEEHEIQNVIELCRSFELAV
ncbi:MAG: aminotransferase class I/II-fold pyridoxal phosphate-dependent enzyme [Flavobacteriales bacterium]|nr:aminotransferase class I/II-fold pyridoxal phosphate-dependent enzyme [Flavobacteriales bacterium]